MNKLYCNIKSVCIFLLTCYMFVSCNDEAKDPYTPVYISQVFDYVYAPGQHATMAQPTNVQFFIGDPTLQPLTGSGGWLYLGGFGGYVVAGFPRNIPNDEGFDFEVFALPGAGPEPAIVYVMQDENGNGLPDDTWYELKGNLFDETDRSYELTYHKPETEEANVRWSDNRGNSGELTPGFGATNSTRWWWSETASDSITFKGSRLPDVYEKTTVHNIDHWSVPGGRLLWGYAENRHGTDYDHATGANKLDISNAVDEDGNAVVLTHIRFLKIQTAVFQQAGMLNEISAEIRGVRGR